MENVIQQLLKPRIITLKLPNYDMKINKNVEENIIPTYFEFGCKLKTLK